MSHRDWKSQEIDITCPASIGEEGLLTELKRICGEAEDAVDQGFQFLILSDRLVGPNRVAPSMLLASSAVHQHLVRTAKRTRVGLIIESGEPREVHHHCLLIGYGADAINPYLAYEALWQVSRDGGLGTAQFTDDDVVESYRKGVAKGLFKVMGKMGISTLQSYKGAQIFEAVGLATDVVNYAFTDTASRVEGIGFDVLAQELFRRHELAYAENIDFQSSELPNPGEFHWRAGGDKHGWEPRTIADVQQAARDNDRTAYDRFSKQVNNEARGRYTLRGLMEFKSSTSPVDISEVEPAAEILRRFCTGAMSLGSISSEAHETLAVAMNRVGERVIPVKAGSLLSDSKLCPTVIQNGRRLNKWHQVGLE